MKNTRIRRGTRTKILEAKEEKASREDDKDVEL